MLSLVLTPCTLGQSASFDGVGHLPGGGEVSAATAVSGDGSVVVGSSDSANSTISEAFRWTAGGGMVGLGDLPGGPFESQARAASANGSVVVGRGRVANGFFEAFRWIAGGGMVGLGDLPGGFVHSDAHAVSADGTVVVGVSHSGNFQAFRWTAMAGMVGLGSVGSGSSFANAVTADGSIVVGSYVGFNGARAAYWTAEDGMVDLRDKLVNEYDLGFDLTGWTLTQAWGISDDGLTIVGRGINESGDIEGWVAQLPESDCFGDVDGDGNVGASDLLALLAAWGTDPGGPPDFDGDGNVWASDLLALLSSWGSCA